MGKVTGISWTDHTWNCWQGCLKVSPGCKFCYMYRDKERYGQNPFDVVRSSPATFNAPLKWKSGRVFTCSWSDFFIEQADAWRDDAWDVIRRTPHLTYQILTKRPERIAGHLPKDWGQGWPHVWLGVSVETPEYWSRAGILRTIPAAIRFLSLEPLLEDLGFVYLDGIHWVIVGGESGPEARPMNIRWAERIMDRCREARVPFFLKQFGAKPNSDGLPIKVTKAGADPKEWPAYLRVQEFPS